MDLNNVFFTFSGPQPPANRRAQKLPTATWNKHRQTIKDLYIDQDKTLNELIKTMKREHGFHATPRQYTQKLKSWHLQKNERRNPERKPRRSASIYKEPICAMYPWPSSVSVKPSFDDRAAQASHKHEVSNRHHLRTVVGLCDSLDQRLSLENPGRNLNMVDQRHTDAEFDRTSSSFSINTQNYSQYLDNSSNESSLSAGEPLTGFANKSIGLRAVETLKRSDPNTFYIWTIWYSVELGDPRVDNMRQPAHIDVSLAAWLGLYPRHADTAVHCHDYLLSAEPGTAVLTWKEYASHGYFVASKNAQVPMDPVQTEPFLNFSVRTLQQSMSHSRDRSAHLRHLFGLYFELLQQELENELEACRNRFADVPLVLSAFREPSYPDSAAAILSMVCDRKLRNSRLDDISIYELLWVASMEGPKLPVEQGLLWACRLALYYAHPALQGGTLPSDLCTQALDGCKYVLQNINSASGQQFLAGKNTSSTLLPLDTEQHHNFVNLWAKWVCRDNNFFFNSA